MAAGRRQEARSKHYDCCFRRRSRTNVESVRRIMRRLGANSAALLFPACVCASPIADIFVPFPVSIFPLPFSAFLAVACYSFVESRLLSADHGADYTIPLLPPPSAAARAGQGSPTSMELVGEKLTVFVNPCSLPPSLPPARLAVRSVAHSPRRRLTLLLLHDRPLQTPLSLSLQSRGRFFGGSATPAALATLAAE